MIAQNSNQNLTNKEMAQTLFKIATLLRDREDNPYRVRAYENGARALMGRRDDAVAVLRDDAQKLRRRKGVLGERLQRKLQELARTGRMDYFAELCADLPPYIVALMAAPGVGPRLAQRLHETLGVETAEELALAARAGRIQGVYGVGPKRTAQWQQQLSLFGD
ncbi:MAG: helix-hairpin-helix domain-containing protein [Janthinobacterium lividum]